MLSKGPVREGAPTSVPVLCSTVSEAFFFFGCPQRVLDCRKRVLRRGRAAKKLSNSQELQADMRRQYVQQRPGTAQRRPSIHRIRRRRGRVAKTLGGIARFGVSPSDQPGGERPLPPGVRCLSLASGAGLSLGKSVHAVAELSHFPDCDSSRHGWVLVKKKCLL